jgi:hypothetical protein
MSGKRCIDCEVPITDEARKLNQPELWCVTCERARRDRISASMEEITRSFSELRGAVRRFVEEAEPGYLEAALAAFEGKEGER